MAATGMIHHQRGVCNEKNLKFVNFSFFLFFTRVLTTSSIALFPNATTMSFLFEGLSWLWNSLLQSLGLAGKEGSLLVLGLDNAGKTTLLYTLAAASTEPRSFPPTDRPALNRFRMGGLQFSAWDLGGHEAVRYLWQDYVCDQVSAVIFLVDAADSDRLEEAAFELDALVAGDQTLAGIPIAVLLNKCDLETAMSTEEVCQRLEWDTLVQAQGGPEMMQIFRISVLRSEGYQQAFRWVGKTMR